MSSESTPTPNQVPDLPPESIHPRDLACDSAGREIVAYVEEWATRWSLTTVEFLFILNQLQAAKLRIEGTKERYGSLPPVPEPSK